DGIHQAGEPGLQGWTIYLDLNNNGMLDTGEPSAVTNAQGNYSFTNLKPGTYGVVEGAQDGWTRTAPPSGCYTVTLTSGQTSTARDTGKKLTNPASISGTKFHDLNGDGIKDPGEPGLQNWRIYLDTNNNGVFDPGEPNVFTDAAGNYSFTNLI